MHLNVSLETCYKYLKHDGSKIVYPERKDPWNRQAFHERELIDLAYAHEHWMIRVDRHMQYDQFAIHQYNDTTLWKLIFQYPTIICGYFDGRGYHAVASDSKSAYDPRGYVSPLSIFVDKHQEEIDTIYVIKSFSNVEKF